MITPRFLITQDLTSVDVHIFIKYAKLKDIDVDIQGSSFWFYLKPYHLNITFPGQLADNSKESLTYDIKSGELIIKLPKANPDEFFPDLDLIANLLQPKSKPPPKHPLIQEIGETSVTEDEVVLDGYGFNHKEKGFFVSREEEMHDLFDINPESTEFGNRLQITEEIESKDWDLDRYFEDLDHSSSKTKTKALYKDIIPSLTEKMEELSLEALVKLGNKDLIVTQALIDTLFVQLTDIVFAFCYEMRCMGEITCESAASINKTSPTLSCLIECNLQEMLRRCSRRFLIYGLYRNFEVIQTAWKDAQTLFREGRICIVRVLLKIKRCFGMCEPKYLLNRLFIDDFIIWVQKTEGFEEFSCSLNTCSLPDISELRLDFSFNPDIH